MVVMKDDCDRKSLLCEKGRVIKVASSEKGQHHCGEFYGPTESSGGRGYWNEYRSAKRIAVVVLLFYIFSTSFKSLFMTYNQHENSTENGCWRDTQCRGPKDLTWPGSWEKYNYSPTSRYIAPTSIIKSNSTEKYTRSGRTTLRGHSASVIYDFGKEVGGIVTVTYRSNATGTLGLAFTEGKNWTGPASDSSNGSFQPDGAVLGPFTSTHEAKYVVPDSQIRGGFRYLTVFIAGIAGPVHIEILDVSLEISFQPDWPNLKAYRGYFSSSDDLLNKIWYAGAYTLQTNAIVPDQGRAWPMIGGSWRNDNQCNVGSDEPVIYVDGSKRDRTVWSGDLAVAIPSILVSTGDWEGVRNTLQVLFNMQRYDGELPHAGPPINFYGSDTYHCITLIGTYDYFLFTNDRAWLSQNWSRYKLAMNFIASKIDSTGMLYVTGAADWGRLTQGGYNSEANMLMYKVLTTGSLMAGWMGDQPLSSEWTALANRLAEVTNKYNFDGAAGAFKDSRFDASIHPQDANALSLLYALAPQYTYSAISASLLKNWNAIGAVAPELPDNHIGLIQSIEAKAHLSINSTSNGLELIRRAWGWYLNHPYGTGSTCIEGYLSDGSFGYRAATAYGGDYSYTSHAHGWSTGPTDALTSYIVGLRFSEPGGEVWSLTPQFGDLTSAEGGFTNPRGRFSAKWSLSRDGYTLEWQVPAGTKGDVVLPSAGGRAPRTVIVDGGREVAAADIGKWDGGDLTVHGRGGKHSILVKF